MAKKKNPTQPQNNIVQTNPSNEDISNEKISRLKSLNTLLLKEATDRRHEVESLMEAKGSLEKVLIRTNSDKEEMMLEVGKLGEEALRVEFERLVMFEYVCFHARECLKEREEFEVAEKAKRDVLEEKMKSVCEELRVEVGEKVKENEELIGKLAEMEVRLEAVKEDRRNEQALVEKSIEEMNLKIGSIEREKKRVEVEMSLEKAKMVEMEKGREEIRIEIEVKVQENQELSEKLVKMEARLNGVNEENEDRRNEIEVLRREKSEIEKVIEEMKGKIGFVEKEKEGVVEELSLEKAKTVDMERSVSRLNETVLELDRVEERLRMDMAELEKKCVEGEEKEKEMVMEIDRLVEENNDMVKAVERVIEEKGLLERKLDEALKRLDDQKKETEVVENEKSKVLEALVGKENEIGELREELADFIEVVKKLESSSNEGNKKVNNLEYEVGRYKDALDRVTVERDEDRKVIDAEMKKSLELLHKIEDMAKIVKEKAKLVDELKAKNAGISDENCELENRCGKLRDDLALAEGSLVEMRKEFDAFRSKVELENESSKRVLDLLKGTAAMMVSSINDEKIGTNIEKQLNRGGSEPYIAELEIIENSFKQKETKGEEMQRQIEILKTSVAEEQKKKSFWTFLSSATSILATISLAYIARGR